MALTSRDRAIMLIRGIISKQSVDIQIKIDEGEETIDHALPLNNKGWFNTDEGLEVFPYSEKIPEVVLNLLQRLYTAAGYSVHWKTDIHGQTNTIVMYGRG